MKYTRQLLVLITIIILTPPTAAQAQTDDQYSENQITIKVSPDETITVSLHTTQTEKTTEQPPLEEITISLDFSKLDDNLTSMETGIQAKLSPMNFSDLANLDLKINGETNDSMTNISTHLDYPGYIGLDGQIVLVYEETDFNLNLDLETKMYSSLITKEELEQYLSMLPLLETQLASSIMTATDGKLVLTDFEVSEYTEYVEYASLKIQLGLSGRLHESIINAFETVGKVDLPEVDYKAPDLKLKALDYIFSFTGVKLEINLNSGGSISGDFDSQLNLQKDRILSDLLEGEDLDEDERLLLEQFEAIKFSGHNIEIDTRLVFDEDLVVDVHLNGLGLQASSFEEMLGLLEDLSRNEALFDFNLVLEGGVDDNRYVVFNLPESTKESVLFEDNRVVWKMENIVNLKDVSYEIKTDESTSVSLVAYSGIGLMLLGVVGYFLMKRI